MQVLETPELDVIFEYMTQHNQVASLEEIFAVKPKETPAPAKSAEAKPADAAKGAKTKENAAPAAKAQGAGAQAQPQNAQPQPQKTAKPDKPHTPRQVAEKRVVDTRGGAAVNIEKYNEKFEDMAGMKAKDNNLRRGNKEKITSKSSSAPVSSSPPRSAARRSATR